MGGGASGVAVPSSRPLKAEKSVWRKNILNKKKSLIFSPSAIFFFLFLNQLKINSIIEYDFFRFVVSVRGGHCDYAPWGQKKL
jgi:hypothetical protein